MDDLESLGRQATRLIFRAVGFIVALQVFILFAAVVGVGLEFLFGPTPLGRIALFVLSLEIRLLQSIF